MLERGSYIPWASRFKRYLNRKRDNCKWLHKALDEGPYEFKNFLPEGLTIPRLQTVEDLEGVDLLLYDAEMELMNMILLSIPNEIYNFVDLCTRPRIWEALVSVYNRFAQLMNDLERNNMNFPTVTINTKFLNSLQPEWLKYVTHVRLAKRLTVDSFDDLFYYLQQFRETSTADDVHNNSEDPLVSAMLLLAKAITQNFSNPTNNRLRASSNTRNQAIIQGDRVNIQSRNSGNTRRNNRRAYVQEEVVEGMNAQNETGNVQRTLRTPSSGNTSTVQCYNCSGKGHYARNCPKPKFPRMEEIEELSANICLMARIQPADHTSDDGPSYESAFINSDDILEDAFKSQQKMTEKMNDPIAVANKQSCWTINYKKLNALYEDFVPQKELSVEQKYFSSSSIPLVKKPSNKKHVN
ncbi:copia protein [Tanacetum coccineum]